jgi:hypothetical protein
MLGNGSSNAHNKLIEALLPEEEDEGEAPEGMERSQQPGDASECDVRDSDTACFDWRIYYATALANMIDIHLLTLDKRRIDLHAQKVQE